MGILYIDPQSGKLQQLIPLGATTSGLGDGGPVSSAKLRAPSSIAIDYQDRLLIFDYDRIRRVDFSASPPTISTFIGGGASTADTIATPNGINLSTLNMQLAQLGRNPLMPLPNGDIWFFSEVYGYGNRQRIRHYRASTNDIVSIYLTGNLTVASGYSANLSNLNCGNGDFSLQFDPATSAVTFMSASLRAPFTGNCVAPASGNSYYFNVPIDPLTGAALAALPSASSFVGSENSFAMQVQAKGGKIYVIDRNVSQLRRYDSASDTWVTLAGSGVVGSCPDNTIATSCAMDLVAAFVDASGNIFMLDRARIRTITGGKIVTIAGQDPSFGDGGLAINARFGTVWSVAQQSTDSALVLLDPVSSRIRKFSRGGIITTIAGNGGYGAPALGQVATGQPIRPYQNYANYTNIVLDPITNDLIYPTNSGFSLGRLSASTGTWSVLAGGGPTAAYLAANGTIGTQINFQGQGSVIQAIGGNSVLVGTYSFVNNLNSYYELVEIGLNDQKLNVALGNLNQGSTGAYCSDGTFATACPNIPAPGGQLVGHPGSQLGSFDSTTSKWLMMDYDQRTIKAFSRGGTISTWATFSTPANNYLAMRFGNQPYIYYCSTSGRIVLKNVTTNAEFTLPWAIPSAKCTSYNMVFDPNTNSLIFPFIQNGLYGVAELLNADPASNGF